MQLPWYQLLLYQLIPIVVVLLPLLEAVGLAVCWRRSLSNPWLYAVVGTLVAYGVAAAVVFASEKYELNVRGHVGGGEIILRDDGREFKQIESPKTVRSDIGPMFRPLTPSWFGLLGTVLILCGVALWGLKFFFRNAEH